MITFLLSPVEKSFMKAELEEYYSRRAATYHDLDVPATIVAAVRRRGVADHAVIICAGEEQRVLDVGTGTGRFLAVFPRCVGVDLTEEMLRRAKVYNKPLVRADAEHLPFRDESFDVVHSAGLLGVYRSAKIIAECARVAKRGGKVYISFPARESISGFFFLLFKKLFNRNVTLLDEWYSLREIHELYPESLKIVKVHRLGFELPFQRWYKNLTSRRFTGLFLWLEERLRERRAFRYFKARYLVEAVKVD